MLLGIFVLFGHVWCDGFDRALHFPKQASLKNYVILKPDFSKAQDAMSVCSWLKITTSSPQPWFSYATNTNSNSLLLRAWTHHAITTTTRVTHRFDWKEVSLVKNEWYHMCFTWKSGETDFYINGMKITTTGTAPKGRTILGGTLILGQEQDSVGGRFNIKDVFNGEMYNMNVFKKKLSLNEVAGMYHGGRCAEITRSLSYDIVLSWKDILGAKRSGAVTEVEAGCDKFGEVFEHIEEIMKVVLDYRR